MEWRVYRVMPGNKKLLLSLLLILISFVWAGSFIVVTLVTEEINPIDLGFLRFLVATPVMSVFLLLSRREVRIPLRELPSLAILGLTGVTLLYVFQFTGIDYTNASTASVLINTNVIFIALLSGLFLKEAFTLKKVTGITLSFLGVIIVVFSNLPSAQVALDNLFFVGSVLVLLSALCWAVYSIVGKRLLETYDTVTIITYAFILGTVFYLPLVIADIVPTIQTISVNGWIGVVYLALISSVFGYIGWYHVLRRTEASKAAVFLNLIPVFAVTMAFFLGETITVFFLVGAILIIYGVYLTQKG